jgi:hypothetical protein
VEIAAGAIGDTPSPGVRDAVLARIAALRTHTIAAADEEWVQTPVPGAGADPCLRICGTDLWLAHGALKFREFPLVLGHEGLGDVVAIGARGCPPRLECRSELQDRVDFLHGRSSSW